MASKKREDSTSPQFSKEFKVRIELDIKPARELPEETKVEPETLVAYMRVQLNNDPLRYRRLFDLDLGNEAEMRVELKKYEDYFRANLGEALLWCTTEIANEAWALNSLSETYRKTYFQTEANRHAVLKDMRLRGHDSVYTGEGKPELRFSQRRTRTARIQFRQYLMACREVRQAIILGKPEAEWRKLGKRLGIQFKYLLDALAEMRDEKDKIRITTKSGLTPYITYKGKFKWQPKMVAYVLAMMSAQYKTDRDVEPGHRIELHQWREAKEAIGKLNDPSGLNIKPLK